MKKIINVRLAAVLAFSVGAGAALSYFSASNGFPYWWLIALVPLTAAFIVYFIVRRSVRGIVFTVLSALLFLYGSSGVYFKIAAYTSVPLEDGSEYQICGKVTEKSFSGDGEYIKITSVTADGTFADGVMKVYLEDVYGEFCDVGYTVSFSATVYASDPFAYGGGSTTKLLEDVRYTAYPVTELQSEYGFSLFGSINSAIRSLYFDNLDEDTAAISYAMFTGNTDFVESSTMDSFRYGGVAHVFAVSGMHIVLVYGAVSFILKRMRLSQVWVAAISVALVFFYTGICGFTLSAVRAAIMCAVAALVRLSGGKYDTSVSLSLAFVAVMLVNPLNIISAGFQLSVAAVAGIALFCRPINAALRKIKIPSRISGAAAVSLSAQIATFPILLSCFGYVSWASLLLNIIFVPLLSAIFTIQFALTWLSLIIQPLAQFFILVFAVPTQAVCAALVTVRAEDALISGFDFGPSAALYFLAGYIISGHVNIKWRWRCIVSVLLAVIVVASLVLKNYVPAGGVRVTVSGYYGGSYAVLFRTPQGNVLVISENPSSYDISSLLSENGVSQPDALIILGGEDSVFAYTVSGTECSDIYVNYTNIGIQPYRGVTVHYEKDFTVAGVDFTFEGENDLYADAGGINFGISFGDEVNIKSCDVLFAATDLHICDCAQAIYFNQVNFAYNVYDYGDLQFVADNGKIFLTGRAALKSALG